MDLKFWGCRVLRRWGCGCGVVGVVGLGFMISGLCFFLKFRVQSFGFEGLRAKGLQCGRFPIFDVHPCLRSSPYYSAVILTYC